MYATSLGEVRTSIRNDWDGSAGKCTVTPLWQPSSVQTRVASEQARAMNSAGTGTRVGLGKNRISVSEAKCSRLMPKLTCERIKQR